MRPDEELLRLFVAVDLPEVAREALACLQQDLRGRGLSHLRWVRPEAIHLTLKFLGETPAEKVRSIEEALADAQGVAPFRLELGPPGTFGGRRGPRVLWLDIGGDVESLRQLQTAVEGALTGAGFPPEERAFSPHLTLARVRQPPRPGTAERISQALEAVTPPRAEFEVRELSLMRSTLKPEGATYERLAAFPLA